MRRAKAVIKIVVGLVSFLAGMGISVYATLLGLMLPESGRTPDEQSAALVVVVALLVGMGIMSASLSILIKPRRA